VNSSFGLPVTGRSPKSILKRVTAKFIWPFLRHQVDVNLVLVNEIRELQARQDALHTLVDQQLSDSGHVNSSIRRLDAQVDFVEDGLHNIENALHILEAQYTYVSEQRESHLADVLAHVGRRTGELENQIDLGHRQLLARFYDGFGALQRDAAELTRQFAGLSGQLNDLSTKQEGELEELSIELERELQTLTSVAATESRKFATLLARVAEVDFFLTEVKRTYPDLVKPERLVGLPSGFDALSSAFVETFRGSFEDIKERVAVYLPELKSIAELGPVLDIGCGRGELLELLAENEESVVMCRARGLDARVDDALHHLGSLPEHSLGAITAIHVVEHLDIDTLITFIDLCLRTLKPGGLIIFETPNPGNVKIGADLFWTDPTHLHPLPSEFLRFVVTMRGFADTEIIPFKRGVRFAPAQALDAGNHQLVDELADMLFGPEDYAVIARRVI
jgi:SAM-dependent methyltransferase